MNINLNSLFRDILASHGLQDGHLVILGRAKVFLKSRQPPLKKTLKFLDDMK